MGDRPERQDAAAGRGQRGRDAARARGRGGRVPAGRAAARSRGGRGAARRRAGARARPAAGRSSGRRRRRTTPTEFLALVIAVKVVDSVEEAIEHVEALRLRALRGDPDRLGRGGARVPARRRRGGRVRQRVDEVHRRRRIRDGRRDRQLDPEAARAGPDRAARAVHVQVPRRGRRARRPSPRRGEVGLLGGTFNPPHIGHLVCAQEGLARGFGLERVLLVPAGVPPHKQVEGEPGPEGRVAMCAAAVAGDERLGVSRADVDREGPAYTVEAAAGAAGGAPEDELSFVVGGDMAHSLPAWREPEEVLALGGSAVAEREGVRARGDRRSGSPGCAGADERMEFFAMPRIDISSSLIRRRGGGRPARPLPRAGRRRRAHRAAGSRSRLSSRAAHERDHRQRSPTSPTRPSSPA